MAEPHVDSVLAMFGYGDNSDDIPARKKHSPGLFKNGDLRRMVHDIRW